MGKFVDMTNRRVGRWIVLSQAPKPLNYKNPGAHWNCVCDCGTERVVYGSLLRYGGSQSCGCYMRETAAKQGRATARDLTGNRYGRWVVLHRYEDPATTTPDLLSSRWVCRCDCGTISDVFVGSLKSGDSKSCGCSFKEIGKRKRQVNPTGNVAHRWVKTERGLASQFTCTDCPAPATQWAYNHEDPDEFCEETFVNGELRRRYYYSTDSFFYDPKCGRCNMLDQKTKGQKSEKYLNR